MNETIKKSVHELLISNLKQCTEPQQLMFKRMYCHTNLDATVEEAVMQMDESKMDHAMYQIERTLDKNKSLTPEKTD